MEPESQKERHGWVLLPGVLAAAAVLGVETAFATGTLGTQYNATIVWDDWDPNVAPITTCEFEDSNQFVRRPISAVFSVCYVYVGFIMIIMTMIDLARSPSQRNLNVLMEREPWWGPTLAIGPLALGAITFLGFASSREFLFPIQSWLWWCIIGNFAAYAWCRLLQEGKGFKSCRRRVEDADEELMDVADSQEHAKSTRLKEVVLSLTSILCLVIAGGMDFLLYVLRRQILENQVQDLLIYLLLIVGVFPIYVHWRLRKETIKVRWWRLTLAGAFGSGAFAILQGDYTLALCVSPTSSFQPYAGWEVVSALTILTVYFFLRGDRAQPQYIVIVQADHRQETGGVVSAFFVPEDDPYRSRKNKVALAVPAETAAAPANGQRGRSDSADSRSSARRTSSAQVESMARGVNGRASIQEMPVGAGALDFGGSTRNNQGSRSPSIVENDSLLSGTGAMAFASSQRVEGSTSSRTSQDSAGGSRRQFLKQRPVGALNRDGSVDMDVQRQRPRSLERRPLNEEAVDGSTRVSSYDRRISVVEESRPRASSIERRLEPRPRPVERGSLADTQMRAGSSISLTGRSSLVERPTQTRPQSLERGFLDGNANPRNSISSARGSISLQQTGRPSSSSFDQYATAPIVAAIPISQVSSSQRTSNSSTPGGEGRPRPPSLTFDQSRTMTSSAETDIPVIVARSRGSNTYESGRNVGSSSTSTTATTTTAAPATRPLPPVPPTFARSAPRSSATGNASIPPPPPPSAPGGPTLASAAAPTSRPGSFVSQASTTGIPPPPGLTHTNTMKSATSSSSSAVTPPNARPSVTFELPTVGSATSQQDMERRPMASSFDSTGRRPPATSFDSTGGSRGRPSGVVPGRPRRSSVDREDNAALRVLNTGMGRSVERERDLAGQGIDVRKIALRTPEEAREASRRLSVGTADDEPTSPLPPQANMSTAERLAALRAERARLEQAKEALQQRRAKQ